MLLTHSLGVLSVHGVTELQQGLKLIVSGESDDLQHRAELTEDLKYHKTTNNIRITGEVTENLQTRQS